MIGAFGKKAFGPIEARFFFSPTLPSRLAMSSVTLSRFVADRITPVAAYASLRRAHEGPSFLLESVIGGERWGRYSILGYRPRRQIVLEAASLADPYAELASRIPRHGNAHSEKSLAARLAQSHVGYLAYDLASIAQGIEAFGTHEPIARLLSDMTVIVFDNLEQTMTIASTHREDIERAHEDLARSAPLRELPLPDKSALPEKVEALTSDAGYEDIVRRAQEYIRAGEARQIVPARSFAVDAEEADGFDVYRALRVLSPSPYMYFLDLPAFEGAPALQIAGASPETLVRWEGDTITLRPIAGTRHRGKTIEEDEALERELLADPKELSEHEMLIELAQADLAPITLADSLSIPSRAKIERYSHVMHIVSEVSGRARPDITPWDIVRASFPAGTLSGSPKKRAMGIIRELEGRPRGIYGGAVGWIGKGSELDLAIAIRTVVKREGRFEVSAGAGIVEASVPSLEAEETWNKAKAGLAAIRAARG